MYQRSDQRGTCPHCSVALHAVTILVEYETDTGTRYYAECPDCGTVVHPE
ncbi:DUF7837 family putative zinc-binding protein [Halosimplex marinum]